jgi:predicted GNAT superfamily acetyltransferase
MRHGDENGAYELTPLPGCGQVVVSHASFIYEEKRGKGAGKAAHARRLSVIEKLGYDFALCTVVKGNEAQERILAGAGWKELASFKSSYTKNTVLIYGRAIIRGSIL